MTTDALQASKKIYNLTICITVQVKLATDGVMQNVSDARWKAFRGVFHSPCGSNEERAVAGIRWLCRKPKIAF